MRLGVVILSCNQLHLTYQLMEDIGKQSEGLSIVIVDNGGSYERKNSEYVVKPPENLRWTRGNNLGLALLKRLEAEKGMFDGIAMLNDDIRISPGFFNGLFEASKDCPEAGLIAPMYDDVYQQQVGPYKGHADRYMPNRQFHECNTVDGTGWYVTREAFGIVGGLDSLHFPNYGWGADLDYCYRIRQAGYKVIATERAYMNHFHQGSAKHVEPDWSGSAAKEMDEGMFNKYGPGWREFVH